MSTELPAPPRPPGPPVPIPESQRAETPRGGPSASPSRDFERLIRAVQQGQRRQLWVRGLLWGLVCAVALALAAAFAARISVGLGRALWIGAPIVGSALAVYSGIFRALRWVGDEVRTARWIGDQVPELARDLLAAVELRRAMARSPEFSEALAEAFLEELSGRAQQVSPRAALDPRRHLRATGAALLSLALLGGFGLAARSLWVPGAKHLLFPPPEAPKPTHEPIAGDVELRYQYPAHTGMAPRTVSGTDGELTGPRGTEVRFAARADRDVQQARWVVNGQPLPLRVTGSRALSGSLILEKSGSHYLAFVDRGGKELARGPDVPIQVVPDAPPTVTLTVAGPGAKPGSGTELEVDPAQRILLKFEASDDYGLTGLDLVFHLDREGEADHRVSLRYDEGRRSRGQYLWDLAALKLAPGERVAYFIAAKDNDAVEGPKTGASQTLTLKVYSAAEHRREALARTVALWEKLVKLLADRLEGRDRTQRATEREVATGEGVDREGQALVREMEEVARELSRQRDAPQELWGALANISNRLGSRIRAATEIRRLALRSLRSARQSGGALPRLTQLTRALDEEISEEERSTLYLESLLDRQRLQAIKETAGELGRERRELSRLLEDYRKAPTEQGREAVLQRIAALRKRLDALMQRMAELARGIKDEHYNAEAVQALMKDQSLSGGLDNIERLFREGKTDEAMTKLQAMAMQLDKLNERLDRSSRSMGEKQNPELTRKFKAFSDELGRATERQEKVTQQTREIRGRYKQEAQRRLADRGRALKDALAREAEGLEKEYRQLSSEPLGNRAQASFEEAQAELESVRNALKTDDFDLAAEAAGRAARAARELALQAEQQRRLDEEFQNPTSARDQSQRLAQRLEADSRRTRDLEQKLQSLFPPATQLLSEADRNELRRLASEQRKLGKQAQSLQQKMEELDQMAPVFGDEAGAQLDQIAERMASASDRLEGQDPRRGYGDQKAALEQLQQFQKQLQESGSGGESSGGLPLPFFAGGQGGFGQSDSREKIEIPDAEQHQTPKEYRQDLLDAMKQGAPERYRDQVKRYYEELVK